MAETGLMTTEMNHLLNRVVPSNESHTNRNMPEAHGLIIAMMHGLTALHMANDPGMATGSGRFGSLITAGVELFRTAWDNKKS